MSTYTPPSLDGEFFPQFVGGYASPPLDQPLVLNLEFIDWNVPYYFLSDLELASTLSRYLAEFLIERLEVRDAPVAQLIIDATLVEQCTFLARLALRLQLTLTGELEIEEELPGTLSIPRMLAEALEAFTTQTATVEMQVTLAESLALLDRLTGGAFSLFVEHLGLEEGLATTVQFTAHLRESLEAEDELVERLVAFLRESLDVDEALAGGLVWQRVLEDGLAFLPGVSLGGVEYTGIVMNTSTRATSTYPQFGAHSITEYRGSLYLATEDGIYRMEDAEDEIERVQMRLRTGEMMFETATDKTVPYGYLYLTATQPVLRVMAMRRGIVEHERTYLVQPTRTQFDRSARGQWWQFELVADEAEGVDLEGAEVVPVVMRNRR